MNTNKIQNIINQGEGISVEFKTANNQLPNNLFETISAFLNKSGGTVLLGVGDDKKIHGVDEQVVDELSKQIANLSNNPQKLFPSFLLEPKIVEYKNKKLISIFIPISSQVHKTSGKIFDRSVDGDFELRTDEQIKQLYIRKSNEYSENKIYPYLSEKDFAEGAVERVRKIIRIYRPNHPWNELSDIEFYKTAGLYRKDFITGENGFTMSALLLFGKPETIQSAIPHYKVDALLRIENLDRYDDRVNIKCNLVEAYDLLMNFVAKHLPDKFYLLGDQRISLREKIFREVVANILIHREYTNAFPTSFIIYKDKVESKNANKPHVLGKLKPGNFEPFPKNPHIAQIFTQMGRSEELGTGVKNVFKYNKIYSKTDKNIFSEDDIFITSVPLESFFSKNEPLNDRLKQIIKHVNNNNSITINELSNLCEVGRETIKRDIKRLRELKIVERIGSDKTGYWKVL